MEKAPPTEAELEAAFEIIDRAEHHITKLMEAARIPGASCYIHGGVYSDHPEVSLNSSSRVFRSAEGKRNLAKGHSLYRTAAEQIEEVGKDLKLHPAR